MRKTAAAAALSLVLVTAAPAAADVTVPAGGPDDVAACVRDAGPGLLTLQAPVTKTSTPTDLLSASPDQVERQAGVDLGNLYACPEIATGGDVTAIGGLVVGDDGTSLHLRVAVRDGTGAFVPPETLASIPPVDADRPSVAVGSGGDAVVAWRESRISSTGRATSVRILASRRPAGADARWGAPEEIVGWREQSNFANEAQVAAGVDGQGRTTLVWQVGVPDRRRLSDLAEVGVAGGARGEPLRSTRLLSALQDVGTPALAVAPDGSALLALPGDQSLRVFERPAGGNAFVRAPSLDRVLEGNVERLAIALDPSGAALVSWELTDYADEKHPRMRVVAARRPAGGAFARPVSVWSRAARRGDFGTSIGLVDTGKPFPPLEPPALRAKLRPDGRAAIGWTDARAVGGDSVTAGYLATGGADGRYAVATLGSPCRPVNVLTPFTGANGDLLAAWADNAAIPFGDDIDIPQGTGRLHVTTAPPGPPAAASPAPGVTVPRPRGTQRLWSDDPVELSAACDRPCDLRAFVPGQNGPSAAGGGTLTGAGRVRLRLYGSAARRKERDVPVVVNACSPDGTSMSRAATRVRLVRRTPPPVPPPLGVRATPTAGGNVIVTWHTVFPARRVAYLVIGQVRRNEPPVFGPAFGFVQGFGHTRFSATVRGEPGRPLRWVSVQAYSLEGARPPREAVVPVVR